MQDHDIFLPVLAQIGLTLWLYFYLGIVKSRAVKLGEVNEGRRALHADAWPDKVQQVNNCIRNQFEVPVLFYILIGVLWSVGSINIFVHVVGWVFVLTRIVHAAIHTGSNYVPLRRRVFTLGVFILIGMLVFSIYEVLTF